MSPDSFIKAAIEAGARDGVASLDADQRLVFLVSEAETLCDMEGIDTFLDRYGSEWLAECAIAFEMIGASEIALDLRKISPETATDDPILERLNSMITGGSATITKRSAALSGLASSSDRAENEAGHVRKASDEGVLDI